MAWALKWMEGGQMGEQAGEWMRRMRGEKISDVQVFEIKNSYTRRSTVSILFG